MALLPDDFETRLARYLYERSEEARAVRVGEKETSEQAAIVARYTDLFTREQHALLKQAEENGAVDHERLFRLREACEGGIVVAELAERVDALENAILACRVELDGEAMPLRAAQARLAVLEDYADRDRLGDAVIAASAAFNDERLELLRASEALEAELSGEPDPVSRSATLKQIDLGELADAVERASADVDVAYVDLRERWLDRDPGHRARAGAADRRTSPTCAGCRRSPPRTRRSVPFRSASRRSPSWGSISPPTAGSGSISTTGRRKAPAPASSRPTHRASCT